MMTRTLSLLIALAISPMTLAVEYTCRSGNEVRTISVEYEHKGWQVPCQVKYDKPAQGQTEYPWSAQASPGYCEDRAAFLADKLANWGWVCQETETSDET